MYSNMERFCCEIAAWKKMAKPCSGEEKITFEFNDKISYVKSRLLRAQSRQGCVLLKQLIGQML